MYYFNEIFLKITFLELYTIINIKTNYNNNKKTQYKLFTSERRE